MDKPAQARPSRWRAEMVEVALYRLVAIQIAQETISVSPKEA